MMSRLMMSTFTMSRLNMRTFMLPIRCFAIVLVVSAFASAQTENAPAATPAATLVAASKPATADFQQRTPRYRIEAGDSFDLTFELSPEFNQTAVGVQPDGFVTLRGVGDLKVAGQTVPELTQTLRTAYSKILNDPLISVVLKDFEKPYFV